MTSHNPQFRHLNREETRHQPYVDGEFTVENEGHLADQPEWKVWLYFGAAKYTEAVRRLRYTGTDGNLYHYEDRRDGKRYSAPHIERVLSHFQEAKAAEKHNAVNRKRWMIAWASWVVTLVVLFIAGMSCDPTHNPDVANAIGMTMIILFFVGAPVMGIAQSALKRRPRELPTHTMFYTDAELEEQARAERQKQILLAGITAAYLAHKYHEHSQERLADMIVERQNRGHGLNGSEWHQGY